MLQPQYRAFNRVSILVECIKLATVLALLTVSTACNLGQAQDKQQTPSTEVKLVSNPKVVALGKIVPQGEVIKISVVNARDSRVNQILVKEGDFVKPNQVIAILQGKERAEQQLRDAMANVAIKRSQLLKIQQGDFKQGDIIAQRATISELEARLESEIKEKAAAITEAQATLRNAELKYQRNNSLAQEGAISTSELDNAQEELDRTRAIFAQAQANFDNTKSVLQAQLVREQANLQKLQEVRPVDVEIAQAELEQALIQVEQRKAELDDTQVKVPIAGQILRINTRVGEQVNTEQGIAELGQTKQMYVLTEVYESDILKVKVGQKATINSEYGGFQQEITGKVEQIGLQIGQTRLNQGQNNPTTDVNARVVEVKIRIEPEDSAKVANLTGMQVRVEIGI
ncbi:HlyD family efflux transporter periplasmic adaptor subunit [Plectonema cf. radiosum LEGE 06105]|uniref:HlyD family efflux transporter periplasmic adaptor subunit n=1 Tax=Plectonema cf. radiosum LEGE 06105 TaxID=945769 RepID=A0A8J7F300_9CYAN|nr:HlyD family efflux transporter periplasmic adaptor subunit [Plectonema radiosum]MBE9215233.1 HlyD family efflux transporter periplasmic adaptor subunit [Plectonema cf. radiosum LEGE 06105]